MALNTPLVAAISLLAMVAPSAPPSTISSAVTLEMRKTGLTPWVSPPRSTQTMATIRPIRVDFMVSLAPRRGSR